jgi:environmental stress-induced protein Ves
MRIIKAGEYRRMPWRNGHGETAQVAIGPEGATLSDFDWRVSMARMDTDGPFSVFPQVDRTLTVLRGDGLHLSIAGRSPIKLTRDSEPLAFAGDVAADATLIGGAIIDLNVMTRRERLQHSMRRVSIAGSVELAVGAPLTLLVCARDAVQVEVNAKAVRLETLDTIRLEERPAELRISSDASALVYLIAIQRRKPE